MSHGSRSRSLQTKCLLNFARVQRYWRPIPESVITAHALILKFRTGWTTNLKITVSRHLVDHLHFSFGNRYTVYTPCHVDLSLEKDLTTRSVYLKYSNRVHFEVVVSTCSYD